MASGTVSSTQSPLARARARLAAGDLAGARAIAEKIARKSDSREASAAHLVLSGCAKRAGDIAHARHHVTAALALDPRNALAHYADAELAEQEGDPEAAIESLEEAVRLAPRFVAAHQLLGILYGEGGEAQRAVDAFSRVVTLDPKSARGYNNLGNALRSLARMDEARAAFERAVALKPDYELAIANVAVSWRDAGDVLRAEALLEETLARKRDKPPLRALVVALAGLLRERGKLDEAVPLYEQAIAMAPSHSAGEWFNLGRVFAERDEFSRAGDAYARSHALDRKDLRGAIASRLSLPMIHGDASELAQSRERYAQGLVRLNAEVDGLVAGLAPDDVLDGLRWTNFFLAYQGGDDRALQASYGRFARRAIELRAPQWLEPLPARPSRARLRVGFASSFFHVGTAGRYFRNWVTELDRRRFEVFVYHLYPGQDDIARDVRSRADRFVEFGGSRARPSVIAPVIRDDGLDVLVYPELGMDHTSFALAALRLAPRQLAGWGHPVTTGHATIDAFVSCDAMEPYDADSHYVERLLRLPGIGTSYRRLAIPERADRARFDLPADRTLLLCPQSLFKVHPDNDALFARVLAANARATLVMFDGRHPRVTDRFMTRVTRALDAHGVSVRERIIVLPPAPHDDYLRINLACDLMLDTLHWSGGNTSLDALACGLPVVTLPGDYMRGRQSAAMLRLAGTPELIATDADDYVRIASRAIEDVAWRRSLAATIRDGAGALFDTRAPLDAFAALLEGY
ncbi:MAG TPA: tetratricopeptide repeat protein [Casimicrobiaceae bacterium]|nr:tetratricopeptide repeat protein [Casimicrobiaceae bacterium]